MIQNRERCVCKTCLADLLVGTSHLQKYNNNRVSMPLEVDKTNPRRDALTLRVLYPAQAGQRFSIVVLREVNKVILQV
jgi:hypothetical protein